MSILQLLLAKGGGTSAKSAFLVSLNYPKVSPTHTLWLFNIAMENGQFIDGLPIENGDFPWLC